MTRLARLGALALTLALSSLAALPALPTSAQTAERSLTVEPATGLDNQVARVSWTGFDPALTVTVFQCSAAPVTVADCYQLVPRIDATGTAVDNALTLPDGTGFVFLEIRPAIQLPELDCSATNPCSVLAFENDGTPYPESALPASSVVAPIDFAPSPADCPVVATPDVTTSGEGSTAYALYAWRARMCTAAEPLAVDYTESSSPEGRTNFLQGLIDVGLTSMPATAEELGATPRRHAYAPVDLSGVVVAFNITDRVTNQRITELNLTPRLVALLIAGSQYGGPGGSIFDDAEFLAANPGYSWPINSPPPLLRAERNADAWLLTTWLDTDDGARLFLDGDDATAEVATGWEDIDYPTDVFEVREESLLGYYQPRTGTVTNARRLFNLLGAGEGFQASPFNDGLFAVLDVVTAAKFGFPTAKLLPADAPTGSAFVAADPTGLAAGYDAMEGGTSAGDTKFADVAAVGAYPLVKVDYAMVPTAGLTATGAVDIASFLDYASVAGQGADVLPAGYVPLPDELRAQAEAVRATVATAVAPTPEAPPGPPPPGTAPSGVGRPRISGGFPRTVTGRSPLPFEGSVDPSDPTASDGGDDRAGGSARPDRRQSPALLAIRDFAGGENHVLLPFLGALGLVALGTGPFLTIRAQRGRGDAPTDP